MKAGGSAFWFVDGRVVNPGVKAPLPLGTLLLLAVLLALAPYAMTFTPFRGIYTFGTHAAPYDSDPLHVRRVGLVALGLAATIWACLECGSIICRRPAIPTVLTCVAAWFACAVVGWRSFPYWINGIYAAHCGRVPRTDFDPKGLIPMTWLGELWRFGALLLYPMAPLVAAAAVVGSILSIRRRVYVQSLVTSACATIGLVFLVWFSFDYVVWLMD